MKVLLVEDNPVDARFVERLLRRDSRPFELDHVDQLASALDRLSEGSFEVALVDMALPDSFGLQTLTSLRERFPDLPIVILTGNDDEELGHEALECGAQDYLEKNGLEARALVRALHYAVDRKRIEARLQNTNQQLEEALSKLQVAQAEKIREERMSALGQMACGIAHDVNNTLSPVLGHADYLLSFEEARNDKEELVDVLGSIRQAAIDAGLVVSRLKAFYRPSERESDNTVIDVRELIEETIHLTQPKWRNQALARGKVIEFETSLAPGCAVFGNRIELKEVLTNLIFNAVDAIQNEGTIDISTSCAGGEVSIGVSDTGVGMDRETQQSCFEPFFTTKGEVGTGLGLAMVLSNVER